MELTDDQARVLRLLASYPCRDRAEEETRGRTEAFVRRYPDCLLRSNLAGHLTAAACVVDPARGRILLIHHRKLGKWLQPGGHADGDADLLAVALKETREETGAAGLTALSEGVFDLDVHPIPKRSEVPEHLHYDVRFLLGADSTAPLRANREVLGAAWVDLGEVQTLVADESVRRLAAKARQWLRV